MNTPVYLDSWISLKQHAIDMQSSGLLSPPPAANYFTVKSEQITLDYNNQKITPKTLTLLVNLAQESGVREKIHALMNGAIVNNTHHLPALHTALRLPESASLIVNDINIVPDISAVRNQMKDISGQIRTGNWLGYSGKPITSIVNIGIGGSDFGPKFCVNALSELALSTLDYYFISDSDPKSLAQTLSKLNPETTLFIVCSKSFTTPETLQNTHKAINWIGDKNRFDKHFIAVTAKTHLAKKLGINQVLPIWDWVGGRFSCCSAINLITCIAIGYESFLQLLAGAHSMDNHFKTQRFEQNMPVILALLGIWNINFLNIFSLLIWVYSKELELFVPYIQQLDMESNGKSIDKNGAIVNYATSPIVWGGAGNQAQHSYYQLLCQGTHRVAADFLSSKEFEGEMINTLCHSKINVLSDGISSFEPSDYIPGGVPINHLQIESCTPFALGQLLALYEHKTYVQSIIWNINAFDQPAVESAKKTNVSFDNPAIKEFIHAAPANT